MPRAPPATPALPSAVTRCKPLAPTDARGESTLSGDETASRVVVWFRLHAHDSSMVVLLLYVLNVFMLHDMC